MRFTTASVILFLCLAVSLQAQLTNRTGPTREMSLADCIRSALEKNISIQIGDKVSLGGDTADLDVNSGGRLGVERSALDVHQSYSYYDPTLQGQFGQRFDSTPGAINDLTGNAVPKREFWREQFSAGLGGYLPTGGRYQLGTTGNRLSGQQFDSSSNVFQNVGFEYSGDATISLRQPLLRDFWIDSGRLSIKLRKQDLKISELSYRLVVMDIMRRVAQAYYDLAAAREQIKVQQKALELAQQLVAENKRKVEVGAMAPLDEKQAESQAAQAKADLTTSEYDAQRLENVLKSLIIRDFVEAQPAFVVPTDKLIAVYQSFSLPESWRNGLEKRPDYLLEKQTLEYQDIVLVYRRNQLYPSLDVQGTYGRNAFGFTSEQASESVQDNSYPKYGGSVILSFPLTFRFERDAYKKAKVAKQALVLSLKRREDLVTQEIDDAIKSVYASYQETESRRAARVYAEAALEAEQKKLENGKSTSFNVLQLQKDLTGASSREIKSVTDYNKALHQLYFNEGTTLERNKVVLDIK